jgi:hypothetical protein
MTACRGADRVSQTPPATANVAVKQRGGRSAPTGSQSSELRCVIGRGLVAALAILCLLPAPRAQAYGPKGHAMVGAIADQRLGGKPIATKLSNLLDGLTLEEKRQADGQSYEDWAGQVVHDEIHKAGWRLAALLEKAME